MGLEQALISIARACGSGRVLSGSDLAAYACDESEAEPVVPEAVIHAKSTADVSAVLAACHEHRVPVTPRGGGTGRVGGAVPVSGGIVLTLEGMDALVGVERDDLKVVAGPGMVLQHLHQAVEDEGLFYAPDPNSLESCRIGGNIATNAGGPRAFKYGVTKRWVLGLEAVAPDGTVLRLGTPTAKGVTGYDLASLVVGSEGTLAVVTQATLRLVPKPETVATLLVFLPDQATLGRAIGEAVRRGIMPRCLEFMDDLVLDIVRPKAGFSVPAAAKCLLLVEVDGDVGRVPQMVEDCGSAMIDAGAVDVLVAKNHAERERLWRARREMSRSMREQATHKLAEDVVVPRTRIADLLDRCRVLQEQHGVRMPSYGHAGDGNLHVNFLWNTPDERRHVDAAIRNLFESVIAMDGTLSGEHGIGILKAPYLELEQSPELIALQERIKAAFDPRGILNPGKIFPAGAKRFHGAC